jgi:hypothetical protein
MMFFTGHKMSPKRYISYFPGIDFIFNPSSAEQTEALIAVTHSVGIIKALNYFAKLLKPKLIIAIDPPDISPRAIKARYDKLQDDLKTIYNEYLENNTKASEYNIYLFRNRKKNDYVDLEYYTATYYYADDTHHPYTIKKIRNMITKIIRSYTQYI